MPDVKSGTKRAIRLIQESSTIPLHDLTHVNEHLTNVQEMTNMKRPKVRVEPSNCVLFEVSD